MIRNKKKILPFIIFAIFLTILFNLSFENKKNDKMVQVNVFKKTHNKKVTQMNEKNSSKESFIKNLNPNKNSDIIKSPNALNNFPFLTTELESNVFLTKQMKQEKLTNQKKDNISTIINLNVKNNKPSLLTTELKPTTALVREIMKQFDSQAKNSTIIKLNTIGNVKFTNKVNIQQPFMNLNGFNPANTLNDAKNVNFNNNARIFLTTPVNALLIKEEKLKNLERIVHIDLKGAQPKIGYYEEFFKLIKQFGATGLLLEYEDVFPFQGSRFNFLK